MKEFLETVADELRRMLNEGCESVALDDDSLKILRRMNAEELAAEMRSEIPSDDEPEEVKFAGVDDLKIESKKEQPRERTKIVKNTPNYGTIPPPTPFKLPDAPPSEKWSALRDIVLSDPVCNAHVKPGKKVVFGVGNLSAKIFFCGEAPGADEEIQGITFVGKAGQLLTKIISAMGLSREDVYIGNIMKWRPEMPTSRGNRPPTSEEMAYCLPYLKAQIDIVKPEVIVALGKTAVNGLLGEDPMRKMGAIRGKWEKFADADLMITYHPSFLLQYGNNMKTKRLVWEDMLAVMERVGLPISEKQRNYFL